MDDKDKLVTLFTTSFTKAAALQLILQDKGIPSVLNDLPGPIPTNHVKVRVAKSQLEEALAIAEEWKADDVVKEALAEENQKGGVLVPVDFSDYSWQACQFAFSFANIFSVPVVLLHSINMDYDSHSILSSFLDFDKAGIDDELQNSIDEAKVNFQKLTEKINAEVKAERLPNVQFSTEIKRGVPEDEIIDLANEIKPSLIVMGTRGQNRKDAELVGSVTAEVIEHTRIPVLAIPENTNRPLSHQSLNVAFVTRFEDSDLKAFQRMASMLKPFGATFHFVHIDKPGNGQDDVWSEIKLSGIRDYFVRTYPNFKFEYHLLSGDDFLQTLDSFLHGNNIDIVSLTNHRRGMFVRMFNPSMAKRMVFHSDTPILTFHV